LDINDKAKILGEFLSKYKAEPNDSIQAFIRTHDLGLPLAYALDAKMITLTDTALAEYFIESTYDDLCVFLQCDPALSYASVDEMFPPEE
jgi:hypothetical protein